MEIKYTHRGSARRVQYDAGVRFQGTDLPLLVVEIADGYCEADV
jgi:hypothetical protein